VCPAILEILEIIVGKGRTVERILKVTKKSRNRERSRKLSL